MTVQQISFYDKPQTDGLLADKQDTLISGTNIKTINNTSVLGSGNIDIQTGVAWGEITGDIQDQTDLQNALDGKVAHVNASYKLYGTDGNDADTTYQFDDSANAYTIPRRITDGILRVGTPSGDNDATTKKYVDDLIANVQANAFELVSKFSSGNYSINANETKVFYYTFPTDADYDYFSFVSVYDVRVNPMNVLGIQNVGTGTMTGAIQVTNMSSDNISNVGVYFYITRAKKRGSVGQHWIYGIPTLKGFYDRIQALESAQPTLTDNTTYYTLNI
jgi:hypothetical protein